MTIKQVITVHNFIVSQQNHWSFYIVGYFMLCITQQNYTIPGLHLVIWFGLGILPFLFYLLRKKVKYRIFQWPIYLVVLGAIFFLPVPHVAYTYIYLGCAAYYCILSGGWDFSKESYEEYKPISILIIFAVTFVEILILQYIMLYEYQRSLVYLVIWNILLYCVAVYVNNYVKYLNLNRHSIGYMPIKNILRSGIYTMLGFSGGISILLFLVANIGRMDDVLQYIVHFFEMLREKVREFMKNFRDENRTELEFYETELGEDWNGRLVPTEKVTEGFSVVDIILMGLVVVILLFLAFRLLRYVLEILKRLVSYIPQTTEEEIEIQESCDVIEKLEKKKRDSILENLTPQMRIRRRYRKKIMKEQNAIVEKDKRTRMELFTARECSDILLKSEIADIYEKARYSPYECTVEDVKKMKSACKISTLE